VLWAESTLQTKPKEETNKFTIKWADFRSFFLLDNRKQNKNLKTGLEGYWGMWGVLKRVNFFIGEQG
jgi:hypothetical protein